MKAFLAITLLVSCSLFAASSSNINSTRAPHYFFQFMEGFDLGDSFPQSLVCNKTLSVLSKDFVQDYKNLIVNERWNKEAVLKFAKTLGEIPDCATNCRDTFNYINKHVTAYRNKFRDSSEFINSMIENLQASLVGIFTRFTSLSSMLKKQTLTEAEFDQILLNLGQLARTVLDFENINRLFIFNKELENIQADSILERELQASTDLDSVIDLIQGFVGKLVQDLMPSEDMKQKFSGCQEQALGVNTVLHSETPLQALKLAHPLLSNCIDAFEGLGGGMLDWVEKKIPTTSQLLTNLLVQMGDISSLFNQARTHAKDTWDNDRFKKAGNRLAKAFQLLFHNVDFKDEGEM